MRAHAKHETAPRPLRGTFRPCMCAHFQRTCLLRISRQEPCAPARTCNTCPSSPTPAFPCLPRQGVPKTGIAHPLPSLASLSYRNRSNFTPTTCDPQSASHRPPPPFQRHRSPASNSTCYTTFLQALEDRNPVFLPQVGTVSPKMGHHAHFFGLTADHVPNTWTRPAFLPFFSSYLPTHFHLDGPLWHIPRKCVTPFRPEVPSQVPPGRISPPAFQRTSTWMAFCGTFCGSA